MTVYSNGISLYIIVSILFLLQIYVYTNLRKKWIAREYFKNIETLKLQKISEHWRFAQINDVLMKGKKLNKNSLKLSAHTHLYLNLKFLSLSKKAHANFFLDTHFDAIFCWKGLDVIITPLFSIMGKLETFTVVFSTQPPVYFPGQTVQGVVNVTLNEDMKMKNIRLLYQGKAYVSLESEKFFSCKMRIRIT